MDTTEVFPETVNDLTKIMKVLQTMNKDWCCGPGKDTWEATTAEIVHADSGLDEVYVTSSCVVTSAAAGYVLGINYDDWELLLEDDEITVAQTPSPPYRVTWGTDWMETEHSATVIADAYGKLWLLQSYFGKYTPKMIPLTPELIISMEKSDLASVTGVQGVSNSRDLRIWYWIPKPSV